MVSPPRSFAADAHDCIMVVGLLDPTEYKVVAREFRVPRHKSSTRINGFGGTRRWRVDWKCSASIGIGGHLAVPPLPHHRAYGSVPRRFGGLSTHQLFHRKQTQTTEASFGEGAMQRFRRAQSPWSLWAENGRTGRPLGDVKASELAIALTARLPLDPDDATQAPSDPAIQR